MRVQNYPTLFLEGISVYFEYRGGVDNYGY